MGRDSFRNSNRVRFSGGIMVKKAPSEKQTINLLKKASDECKKSVAAIQEACATIYDVEIRIGAKQFATKKHLKLAIIINAAITALIVLAGHYV